MPFSLLPNHFVPAVTAITPAFLAKEGIQLLMLDYDNTMVPYTTDEPSQELLAWIAEMRNAGVQLCVVSNSRKQRVPEFCRKWDLPCITHARKPSPEKLIEAAKMFHVKPAKTALAGDQIYTDVLAANRAGAVSIYVRAICQNNLLLQLRHVAELPWVCLGRRKNERE